MASTYVNDLRLNEMATGDQSGAWGTVTNTNLELIGDAFGYATEAITTNADTHATVIADGAADAGRAMVLKYTGTLDSACTITISGGDASTFTVSKLWYIHNATSGSQNIIITSGSGANITIAAGQTKCVYTDGAGSGGAVIDTFAALSVVDLFVDDDLTVTDDLTVGGDIDLEGSIDVNGTANLDAVDIDGAVQIDAAFTSGLDGQGYDTKFFGDTASAYMLWDTSADDLILGGGAGLVVPEGQITIAATAMTSSAAELNILDGVTTTTAEINLIDGGTARGTTALADGDGMLVNDAGTMRMSTVQTVKTYMTAGVGGGLVFIATTDVSNAATISFTGFDASLYDSYVFSLGQILPATDNAYFTALVSVDNGDNYLSASDSYTGPAHADISAGDQPSMRIGYYGVGNVAGEGICGTVELNHPHLNACTLLTGTEGLSYSLASGAVAVVTQAAVKTKAATVVDAIQFKFVSGNIASGTITMYGRVNS